jgi:hypothetical protein
MSITFGRIRKDRAFGKLRMNACIAVTSAACVRASSSSTEFVLVPARDVNPTRLQKPTQPRAVVNAHSRRRVRLLEMLVCDRAWRRRNSNQF